jgi:Zn-dependent protease with chaperone function
MYKYPGSPNLLPMVASLLLASVVTLGVLFSFLLTILFTAGFLLGYIDIFWLIGLTLVVNVLIWLLSPYLSDFIYRFFYKVKWANIQGLRERNPEVATFVESVCEKHGIKVPKIGFIEDDNPTAFTYGSGTFNARIVFTRGIIKYLDIEEQKCVFAHELGHIVHRDFIVMTVASVILQLLYEMYFVFTRFGGGGDSDRKGGYLVIVGIASYVFYIIGTYIILYLSRIREYYADEFAAMETGNPRGMSNALIKVAYGIVAAADTEKTTRLLQSTRAMGIFDHKAAKEVGLAYLGGNKAIAMSIIYDIRNPWALLAEISSTHPLTGKRILRLSEIAEASGQLPLYRAEDLKSYPFDRGRMYGGFLMGLLVQFLPTIGMVFITILFIITLALLGASIGAIFFGAITMAITAFGLGMLLRALYKFPGGEPAEESTVVELMSDLYASPVRGKPVRLNGTVVGRGQAGAIFTEDMMLQDSTGLIYLDYEGLFPLVSNLIQAFTKMDKCIGSHAAAEGWFFRSLSHYVALNEMQISGEEKPLKSYVKLWSILGGFLALGGGGILTILVLAAMF